MNVKVTHLMISLYSGLSEDLEGLIAHIDQELKERK